MALFIVYVLELKQEFWGTYGDPPPSTKNRGVRIKKLLETAFDKSTKSFSFPIRDNAILNAKSKDYFTVVCEGNLIEF